MPSLHAWGDQEIALRRFAAALARDDILVRDDRSAHLIADPLVRQSVLACCNSAVDADPRIALFRNFIERFHRHLRKTEADDEDSNWALAAAPRGADLRSAVHRLPLAQREAVLLVVVERFSHAEAAEALDISLAQLAERLTSARRALAGARAGDDAPAATGRATPHLRLVK